MVAVLCFAVYLTTSCPTVHWLDGGELSTSAFHIVAGHAPGEPVFVLLGKLFSFLPVGSIAFRLNLLSAVCAASSAALLYYMVHATLLRGDDAHISVWSRMLALLATLTPFLSYPIWIQSVRTEVYALHLLLAMAGLGAALKAGLLEGRLEPRWTAVGALFFGLDLAVHTLLAGLVLLPVVFLGVFRRGGWAPRVWFAAFCAGTLGFSSYLMLPLRSRAHPTYGWGQADSLTGFLDILLARSFQHNFSSLGLELVDHNLGTVRDVFLVSMGMGGLVLGLGGLITLVLGRQYRALALIIGIVVCNLWSVLPQNKLFGDNPDVLGYLAIILVVLWLIGGVALIGVGRFGRKQFRLAEPLLVLLMAGLAVPAIVVGVSPSNRRDDYLPRDFATISLNGLAPGGYLQVSGNDTTFLLQYLQHVEQFRPDVTVLSRSLLTHSWYRARIKEGEEWLRAAAGGVGGFTPRVLPRAVRVELREADLPAAALLCPAPAPGWGFFDVAPCPAVQEGRQYPPLEGLLRHRETFSGPEVLSVGLNAGVFLAEYYASVGRPDWSAEVRAELRNILPGVALPDENTTP